MAHRMPSQDLLEGVMYKSIVPGFAFFTRAIILGTLWAAEAWDWLLVMGAKGNVGVLRTVRHAVRFPRRQHVSLRAVFLRRVVIDTLHASNETKIVIFQEL